MSTTHQQADGSPVNPNAEQPSAVPRILGKSKRQCRWTFTTGEKLELAQRQAESNAKVAALEEDKKRVMAQYKADIEAAMGQRDEMGRKVSSGYEFRDLPCTCYADMPKLGEKSWIRDDTLEVVDKAYMTGADLQSTLPGIDAPSYAPTSDDGEEA